MTILTPRGSCCLKSWRDQKHLTPSLLGLNVTLVPNIDRSLVSLTNSIVAILKSVGDFVVFRKTFVCYAFVKP